MLRSVIVSVPFILSYLFLSVNELVPLHNPLQLIISLAHNPNGNISVLYRNRDEDFLIMALMHNDRNTIRV
jgi:hypothetical protein